MTRSSTATPPPEGLLLATHAAGPASLVPVRLWILALAALVVAMVAVGGATRLTGSGLSITEWRPVTGAIPPLTEAAWLAEFERYRAIPQYELLNQGMTLAEFKVIYAWEWGHRQLGRLIGLVFFVPLAWFWAKGAISRRLGVALLAIGALGALQGVVGWIMVASGLEPGMVAVAPIKLTIHLLLASIILAGLVWIAAGLHPSPIAQESRKGTASLLLEGREVRIGAAAPAKILLALLLLQIAAGGLVAGSKAGLTYNTWPLMDGALVPPASALFVVKPWLENFIDNVALVQFNHRSLALVVVAFALWHAVALHRTVPGSASARRAGLLAGLTILQMSLGITALLLVVPLWAGLAHQVLAMALLALAAAHAQRSGEGA